MARQQFIVAGAMKADLLKDLNSAVEKAIREGKGLEEFRKDFAAIVRKNGWTGWTGEGSVAGEAWRTKVIYQTNMATSYAAGRYKQLTDPDFLQLRPYWRYVHADGVMYPRPVHAAWGTMRLTLRYDHPFWKTHFPPNGWGCHCYVNPVDGPRSGDATEPPAGWNARNDLGGLPGIDKGFDYAPGASVVDELRDFVAAKVKTLPESLGIALENEAVQVLGKRVFVEAKTVREAADWAVKNNLVDFADYSGIKVEVANSWNKSLFEHLQEFPALRPNQKFTGTCQAQNARWRELEIERYINAIRARNPQLPPDYDFRSVAERFVKARKVDNRYAHSWAQPNVSGIAVNKKWGNDVSAFEAALLRDVRGEFHPIGCDTIRSVVDHELAHQLDDLIGLHIDTEVISLYKEVRAKGIRKEVSGYADKNIHEFIAECWAEALNSPSPRAYAARIASIIRQRYADKFSA